MTFPNISWYEQQWINQTNSCRQHERSLSYSIHLHHNCEDAYNRWIHVYELNSSADGTASNKRWLTLSKDLYWSKLISGLLRQIFNDRVHQMKIICSGDNRRSSTLITVKKAICSLCYFCWFLLNEEAFTPFSYQYVFIAQCFVGSWWFFSSQTTADKH